MIYGLQKITFIDYPNEVSFMIFLGGCNFKCPYCHNKSIVFKTSDMIKESDVIKMLKERFNFIKHVVITGGEPTIYGNELIELFKKIKNIGYDIKLDTNGTNPDVIKKLLDLKLVSYFAMDIKNAFSKYNETTGVNVNINNIKESIKLIEDSGIPYIFRSTINKTMHNKKDINEIKTYVKDKSKLIFQDYKYSKEQIVDKDFGKYEKL